MKTKAFYLLILQALFVSLYTNLSAETYTVSTVDEFKEAAGAATAGDEILVAPGVYRDAFIQFRMEGTKGQPIKIKSQIPGKAIISGKSAFHVYENNLNLTYYRQSSILVHGKRLSTLYSFHYAYIKYANHYH
ncbi:MAG: hypothetical protein MI975_27950 [Cytophagales bacterium]|nr:hypothetical protein [Cytophagales bacterium]